MQILILLLKSNFLFTFLFFQYNLQKADSTRGISFDISTMDGRIVGSTMNKTPQQIAQEMENDDSINFNIFKKFLFN